MRETADWPFLIEWSLIILGVSVILAGAVAAVATSPIVGLELIVSGSAVLFIVLRGGFLTPLWRWLQW